MNSVVNTKWLAEHLNDQDLVILGASQSTSVNQLEISIQGKYIPGAIPFSLKAFSDPDSDLPNTLPSPDYFERKCIELGVNNNSKIVVYDNAGIYWSPRVWWMFHAMGHDEIAVLDGGLPAWIKERRATTEKPEQANRPGNFKANFKRDLIKTIQDVNHNLKSVDFQLVDARSRGRFDGTAPEPREGLKSGHIPNSSNIPFEIVLKDGFLKSSEELTKIFEPLDVDKPMTFSCGSGLTACIISLAHSLVTDKISPVYDGSWTEWAQSDGPIHTSEK